MNRIDILASLCKGSNIICDVGCDHGYVIVNALKYHGVKEAIACDVASEPLNQARINVLNNNLDDRVKFYLSDGFKNVDADFDTAIIAGMGGNLIASILENGLEKIVDKRIIVEPNNHQELVRDFMTKNGFIIESEIAINDKKHYYEIITFIPGNKSYTELEIKYGPILLENKPIEFVKHYEAIYTRMKSYQDKIASEQKKNINEGIIKELAFVLGE